MNDRNTAKAGKLLLLDTGEYSDHSVVGFFLVLRDFDPIAELKRHLDEHPGQKEKYHFRQQKFLAWLLAKGLLLEIDYGNFYLGSYSSCDDLRFAPPHENQLA